MPHLQLQGAERRNTLVVTRSNVASANSLLVFHSTGALVQTISTGGLRGVSGNAGGVAATGSLVAVVKPMVGRIGHHHLDGRATRPSMLLLHSPTR